jgi:hypothetical protein
MPTDRPPAEPASRSRNQPLPRISSVSGAPKGNPRGADERVGDRDRGRREWLPTLASSLGWAFFVGGFVLGLRPFFDNSLYTHLATGRLIVAGGVPHTDPYSFTANGAPWVVQSWLVSAAFGFAERGFGIVGVRVFAGVLVAGLLGLTWRLTAPARSLLPRLVIAGLFVVACSPFLSPRPLLVGLIALALSLVVITEKRDPRWLIPIMWVWTNAHGSFPLGLVAIGCWTVGGWLDGERDRAAWKPLGWAVAGTLLGAINPIGPTLLVFPVSLLGKMEVLSQVVEWKSPDFTTSYARLFLVQVVVAIVVLVRRPQWRLVVPLVVFVAAALLGQRNIPDASLVLVPGLAIGLAGLGSLDGRERGPVPSIVALGVLVAGLFMTSNLLAEPAFDLTTYPTDGIAWLAQNDLIGPEHRVATEDTTGNTLEILYGTEAGTFFDDRYDMYPLELARDYLRVHGGQKGWEEALDKHQVGYLMWSTREPVAQLVAGSDHWRVLYQDDRVFIACRRGATDRCR